MALTVLLAAALSGCDNFDNPLRWKASPIADDLIGTWKAVEGPDTGVRARVSRMDDGALDFELTYPENTKSTVRSNRDRHRATFLGDVLASESVHILQVRIESYDEFDKDGESLWDSASSLSDLPLWRQDRRDDRWAWAGAKRGARQGDGFCGASGFLFQRISPAPDKGFHLQRLNLDAIGKVAEEEIADSGFKIEVNAFAGCLSDDIRGSLWTKIWTDTREKLDDKLRTRVQDALELGQQEVAEIERESARLGACRTCRSGGKIDGMLGGLGRGQNTAPARATVFVALAELKVDPYAELAHIRNCVALRLPSESLERIFLLHTNLVFSGGVDRYIRE